MREFGVAGTAFMVLAAIGITTAMDARGLSDFSALPLLPLAALAWWLGKYSRQAMGIAWGRLAATMRSRPLCLSSSSEPSASAAWAMGFTDFGATDWSKAVRNLAAHGDCHDPCRDPDRGGISFADGSSHPSSAKDSANRESWSAAASRSRCGTCLRLRSHADFVLPAAQIPVFLVNAAVIGAIWCVMRTRSGSVVVSSVSHGLWNGGAYVLFGYGQKVGALGIADTAFFGPENGLLGLALNLVFLAAVVRWPLSRR